MMRHCFVYVHRASLYIVHLAPLCSTINTIIRWMKPCTLKASAHITNLLYLIQTAQIFRIDKFLHNHALHFHDHTEMVKIDPVSPLLCISMCFCCNCVLVLSCMFVLLFLIDICVSHSLETVRIVEPEPVRERSRTPEKAVPATSGGTGKRPIQQNYHTALPGVT
jgi:hypothetical protein